MYRPFICILLLIFLSLCTHAQVGSAYHIRQFTTDDGLPSNGIKGMQWDEQTGFLWIATEAGIARYNGLSFMNFTKENTPGLSQERMSYIVKNSAGEIFTADVGGNILRIHNNKPVGLDSDTIVNSNGAKIKFWLSVSGKILRNRVYRYIYSSGSMNWESLLQLNDSSVLITDGRRQRHYIHVSEKKEGVLPFAAAYRSIFKVNGQLFARDSLQNTWRLNEDLQKAGRVSVVDENGQTLPVNKSNAVLYWDTGMEEPVLFEGSNAWLLQYHNGAIQASLICNEIPSYSYIRNVQYSKKNKTLFIGTDSKGIIIINNNKVFPVKKKGLDIRELNSYYAQIELPGKKVLTNQGHILGGDGQSDHLPIIGRFAFTTYKSGDSLLWYIQYNTQYTRTLLHRYDYRTGKTLVYNNAPPVAESFAITQVESKLYFVSSSVFGLLEGDSLKVLRKPAPGSKPWSAPYTMMPFAPGVVGIASCSGLDLYNLQTGHSDTILKFPGYCVRTFWKYRDYIFIGTYGKGFFVWKNGVVKPMPLDKNNFLLYTHCFVPDADGFCWISTNRGLFKAQLSDLVNAYEQNIPQVYYHYFGRNDGMEITEMNGGCVPCAITLQDQTISFPTMDGLLWVQPASAKPLLPEGKIFIDEFIAGKRKIDADSLALTPIPYASSDIMVRLGFSSWCNKENIYIDYKLGEKEHWSPLDIDKGAVISLNNLAPGNYKIFIRKLNGFGTNNYSYREISFSIRTPWNRQWWFLLICALALAGLVVLFFQWRTRQYKIRQRRLEEQVAEKTKELQQQNELLEKNNTIKTRLISIISHDIVTPLKFLTVAGKNLLEKRTMMNDKLQEETIREMANTSQELQLLSTNILNWIKYQHENRRLTRETFSIHEVVNQVFGVLTSLARQKNIRLQNDTDPSLAVHQYLEPVRILIYNLVTNAINFSEQGTIRVHHTLTDQQLVLYVTDEGVGMTQEQIQNIMADQFIISSANIDNRKGNGLGYLIIKDLLKTMDATLRITSEKGTGTSVAILFDAATLR